MASTKQQRKGKTLTKEQKQEKAAREKRLYVVKSCLFKLNKPS